MRGEKQEASCSNAQPEHTVWSINWQLHTLLAGGSASVKHCLTVHAVCAMSKLAL